MRKNNSTGFEFSDGKIVRKKDTEQPREIKQSFFESLVDEEDEDNVSAFENAKSNFETRKTRERIKRISLVAFLSLIVITCFVFFGFSLRTVNVSGSSDQLNESIKKTAESVSGKNVLFLDTTELENAILGEYPGLKSVSVKKKLPSGIDVTVTDDIPLYHISFDGEYYLLSEDLRITERTTDPERTQELVELTVSDVKKALTGEVIEFYYDYQYDYIRNILKEISEHEIGEKIISVDAEDKFGISCNYEGRFTVKLGVGENIPTKLTLAMAYIDSLPENEMGIIDSSSTEKGSYISTLDQHS